MRMLVQRVSVTVVGNRFVWTKLFALLNIYSRREQSVSAIIYGHRHFSLPSYLAFEFFLIDCKKNMKLPSPLLFIVTNSE